MAVVLDPSLSDICRRLSEHRRYSAWLRTRCAAGCGRWPCTPFLRALEEMLRSSWLSYQTGAGPRPGGAGPLGTPNAGLLPPGTVAGPDPGIRPGHAGAALPLRPPGPPPSGRRAWRH